MTDRFSPEVRSRIMSKIRSKHTKGEETIAKILDLLGVKYERYAKIAGHEVDFLIPDRKMVIEYRGCFWHGCRLHCRIPETNRDYWEQKIRRNIQRDRELEEKLRQLGYELVVFWSHDDELLEMTLSYLTTKISESPKTPQGARRDAS